MVKTKKKKSNTPDLLPQDMTKHLANVMAEIKERELAMRFIKANPEATQVELDAYLALRMRPSRSAPPLVPKSPNARDILRAHRKRMKKQGRHVRT